MTKGTLLIGFGSNKPDNQKAMADVVMRVRTGLSNVYFAYIGGDEPTIGSAIKKMSEDGIDDVTVIPFLTATGEMSMRYIPRHLGIEEDPGVYELSSPKMTIRYCNVIGEHPNITDIIEKKVASLNIEDDTTGIMLITHGSQLRYNSKMAQAHADRLTDNGHKHVLTAFLDYNEPTIEDCVKFMANRGANKIIAVPLLMASDDNHNEHIPEALGIGKSSDFGSVNISGKDVDIYLTKPVGTDDGILEIIKDLVAKS